MGRSTKTHVPIVIHLWSSKACFSHVCTSPSACYCYICKRHGLGVRGAKTFHFVTLGSPENQSRATQIKKAPNQEIDLKIFLEPRRVVHCEDLWAILSCLLLPFISTGQAADCSVYFNILHPFIAAWHIETAGQIGLVSFTFYFSVGCICLDPLFPIG